MRLETHLAQIGNRKEPRTGAVSFPIYHSTTYSHPGAGESTGYDYTRTKNPTREALEEAFALMEGASSGFAFASGMAAVGAALSLFDPGDHVLVSRDLYGGTYRLFETVAARAGLIATYVDTDDLSQVRAAILPTTKALFIESPTNPTMRVTDLTACAQLAKTHDMLTIVDNTFMTPFFQRPLDLGADIVLHSATKYLGGHNDVLAGLLAVADKGLAERVGFWQNAVGAVLGPQDSWLLMRGMKTLAVRMERHEQNANQMAEWLCARPEVARVYYPGLEGHPGRAVHEQQASGYGGMISFELADPALVDPVLNHVQLITFAESLGSVETLITHPARQTHADIPREIRESYGVTDGLMRLSVGIEHVDDLLADLAQALTAAASTSNR